MKEYLAYIDESGDPNFGPQYSKFFFMASVVIEKDLFYALSDKLDTIVEKHDAIKLKSSKISHFPKRKRICDELASLDLRVITLRVDKSKLSGEWFKYRTSFYKFIQKKLHHEICRLFGNVQVTLHRYGSEAYQASLHKYLIRSLQIELFDPVIEITSDEVQPFIRVADFLSGSVRKALEGDFPDNSLILASLKPIWKTQLLVPDRGKYLEPIATDDANIEIRFCLDEAERYLNTHSSRQDNPKIRTLEYLFYSALDNPHEYIYTNEILGWLSHLGMHLTEEQFRNEVTASLRDDGLIIVGSRKGLKIPTKVDDLLQYLSFSVNLALPVLKRLKKAITFATTRMDSINISDNLSEEMRRILNEVNA